ncbi:formylglycine-generating enzyme family protein [Francisellaceae bacterium]|nr:formylglycine-generating enzyme family protein [Francisellaceae bacterium]
MQLNKIVLVSLLFPCLAFSKVYHAKLDCDKTFMDKIGNDEVEACYAKNYTDYSPLEVANQFLDQQVLVKGGEFTLKYKPTIKVNMPSFYFGEYLIPYQQFNTYLKATNQWDRGLVKGIGRARLGFEKLNGLYPAQGSYDQAQNFCQWMGKITGLPVELPAYGQWLYAATSEGKNWEYPTNNGKLEIGDNFPDYAVTDQKALHQLVTGLPVNSLGIHQLFGNGYQYSSSVYNAENSKYFSVLTGQDDEVIMGGRFYYDTPEQAKRFTLDSVFARTGTTDGDAQGVFRCVINTDKPIAKHLDKLKD